MIYKIRVKATVTKDMIVLAKNESDAIETAYETFSILYDEDPERYSEEVISIEELSDHSGSIVVA